MRSSGSTISMPILGDVRDSWADVSALARDVGYRPSTDLEQGVKRFVEWYLAYYHPPTR